MAAERVSTGLGPPGDAVSFHPEGLKLRQREVLPDLARVASRYDFYLAGGTAIALHLGHRHSVDFDWFRQPLLEGPLELARALKMRESLSSPVGLGEARCMKLFEEYGWASFNFAIGS